VLGEERAQRALDLGARLHPEKLLDGLGDLLAQEARDVAQVHGAGHPARHGERDVLRLIGPADERAAEGAADEAQHLLREARHARALYALLVLGEHGEVVVGEELAHVVADDLL
jgi:hypothetical protein